jgi:hypothetical protein
MSHLPRRCERSEAIQGDHTSFAVDCFVAALLAMTRQMVIGCRREKLDKPKC